MKRRPFLTALLYTCWIPFVFAAIAVSVQALRITGKPTEYVALGKIVAGQKRGVDRSPINNLSAEFYGTQKEIIESGELRRRALERVRSLHPELKEMDVEIRVSQTKGSAILNVAATGGEPKYTRVYLDALLDEYIAFCKEVADKSMNSKMNSVIEKVLACEKKFKEDRKELETFEQQNDPALLSAEHERLVKELSTLRGEVEALKRSSDDSQLQSIQNSLKEAEKKHEEVWAKEVKHQELKKRYEDSEKEYQDWKKSLPIAEDGCPADTPVIMERPTAAVPDEPDLWLALYLAGFAGASAGVVVMFIAAFALTRLSKNPAASPPPLN